MRFLEQRRRQPEIMDQPDLDPVSHHGALAGLARINFFSRSAAILWSALLPLARERPALRLLDVACGGGDVPIRLWLKARQRGLNWQVSACDFSPLAIEHARERARRVGAEVSFFVQDALLGPPLPPADAVTSSLFLHHLDEADALNLLRRLARPDDPLGPALVVVNDLDRSLAGYFLARIGTRLLSRSPVVHFDGPASVEAAFTLPEARSLAERAGLVGAVLRRRWPCRWLLRWRRP